MDRIEGFGPGKSRRTRPPLGIRVPWAGLAVTAGAIWAAAIAIAVASPAMANAAVATALGAAAFGAWTAAAAFRHRRRELDRLSADLTAVSARLLRVEGRASDRPAEPGPPLRSEIQEIASDLNVLGRLLAGLAEAVRDHDRRLSEADAAPTREPEPRSEPPQLETREDFARATAAILHRLALEGEGPMAAPPEAARRAGDDEGAAAALAAGRIELHLQPIVTLPQRHTRLYEARPRLRDGDGRLLDEAEAVAALERGGRRTELDLQVLDKAAAVARFLSERGSGAAVAVAVSPDALADPSFAAAAGRLVGADRELARRLVVTLRQRDLPRLGEGETDGAARLCALGIPLRLDGVGLDTDWAALVRRGFDFVAIDCGLILEARPPGETGRRVEAVRAAGLGLIASAVDRESLVPDLLDYDVPLATGPALGAARPVRPEIAAGHAVPAAAPAPSGPDPSGFRDYLRRAG